MLPLLGIEPQIIQAEETSHYTEYTNPYVYNFTQGARLRTLQLRNRCCDSKASRAILRPTQPPKECWGALNSG